MGNASSSSDSISLKDLILRFKNWLKYLVSKLLWVLAFMIVGALIAVAYNALKTKKYYATTTFVLQNAGNELNDISSLASLAGVNLGALSESSDLFQIDNIQELYRSHTMISESLLSPFKDRLLIDHFVEVENYKRKWSDELSNIDFSIPREDFTRSHDSLLLEFTDDIRKGILQVSKPSRKLSILNVTIVSKDENFAKYFNQAIVKNVNEFYKYSKTEKSGRNLAILQKQADSVRRALDESILRLAEIQESTPNLNPLYKSSIVPEQQAIIDITANTAMYEALVTNLEIAKVSHRNNTPLIQIIDRPILPLNDNRWKNSKSIIIGAAIGGFFIFIYLVLARMLNSALKSED